MTELDQLINDVLEHLLEAQKSLFCLTSQNCWGAEKIPEKIASLKKVLRDLDFLYDQVAS